MAGHSHDHGHAHHHADTATAAGRRALTWAFAINAAFLVVEAVGGWISGSLALLADAGHMVSDVTALGIALIVSHLAQRRSTDSHSYGFGRVEVLSGLLNGLTLWVISLLIVWEAWQRLQESGTVDVAVMLPVAVAGLLANVVSAWVLYAHRSGDLNMRAAFLHLAADAAGSVGAILAALAIAWKGWGWVDPAASAVIAVLIVVSSWGIVRESIHILLEGTPGGIDLNEVRTALLDLDHVHTVHDLHVWTVASHQPMFTAHLQIDEGSDRRTITTAAVEVIRDRFGIRHTTLQVEEEPCEGLHCEDPA